MLAYSKIRLSNHLLDSDLPDDPYFASEVQRYFTPARKRYAREISRHRLRREIIATATTNSLVNRMGRCSWRAPRKTPDADPAAISRAYTIAREIYSMRSLWADIESLDNTVAPTCSTPCSIEPPTVATHQLLAVARTRTIRMSRRRCANCAPASAKLTDAQTWIGGETVRNTKPPWRSSPAAACRRKLARRVARLALLEPALDIVAISRNERAQLPTWRGCTSNSASLGSTGCTARSIGSCRWSLAGERGTGFLERRFVRRTEMRELTQQVLRTRGATRIADRVARWSAQRADSHAGWKRTLTEMRATGAADFATLTVGVDSVRNLANA